MVAAVMAEAIARAWRRGCRAERERRFAQTELVVRAHPVERR